MITSKNDKCTQIQKPFALWLTGLPSCGKSTLGSLLVKEIKARGHRVQLLDSDELRKVLTPEPTYNAAERDWFYSTLVNIGNLLFQNDVKVVFAATAHLQIYRQRAREMFPNFMEIYLKCPLKTCIERDNKGIYRKAFSGEAETVPGVQVLYEEPEMAEIIVDTQHNGPKACLDEVVQVLEAFHYL